uniref:Uncharacterized protein LOC105122890 n=1 Tax=Rhizophora mucronata TaxID=61149 RepID=A0A2P2MCZ3_RHIMU
MGICSSCKITCWRAFLQGSCQGSFSEANAGKVDLDLSIYACWSSPSWGNYWCCGE